RTTHSVTATEGEQGTILRAESQVQRNEIPSQISVLVFDCDTGSSVLFGCSVQSSCFRCQPRKVSRGDERYLDERQVLDRRRRESRSYSCQFMQEGRRND